MLYERLAWAAAGWIVSLSVMAMRVAGHTEIWFQALAHIYVGFLIGVAVAFYATGDKLRAVTYGIMAGALGIVEGTCFAVSLVK